MPPSSCNQGGSASGNLAGINPDRKSGHSGLGTSGCFYSSLVPKSLLRSNEHARNFLGPTPTERRFDTRCSSNEHSRRLNLAHEFREQLMPRGLENQGFGTPVPWFQEPERQIKLTQIRGGVMFHIWSLNVTTLRSLQWYCAGHGRNGIILR